MVAAGIAGGKDGNGDGGGDAALDTADAADGVIAEEDVPMADIVLEKKLDSTPLPTPTVVDNVRGIVVLRRG